MKKRIPFFFFCLLLLVLPFEIRATETKPVREVPPEILNLVTEKQCLVCHKPFSSLNTPRLHGAEKDYLLHQLKNFKSGKRKNLTMQGVAQKLSELEMEKLTDYFSGFDKCEVTLQETTGPGNPEEGKKLAGVCLTCHEATQNMGAPILESQNGYYLANQLRSLKYGQRENPMMAGVVKDLSEDDIINLAAYFSSKNSCDVSQKIIPHSKISLTLPSELVYQLREKAKAAGKDLNQLIQKILEGH